MPAGMSSIQRSIRRVLRPSAHDVAPHDIGSPGLGDVPRNRARWFRGALVFAAMPVFMLLVAPVQVTTFDPAAPVVISETRPANPEDLLASDLTFTISSLSSSNVSFLGPLTSNGHLLTPNWITPISAWIQTDIGGVITQQGASVRYEVNARVVEIVLEGASTTSHFVVTTPDGSSEFVLSPPQTQKTIYVNSGVVATRTSDLFMLRSVSAELDPNEVAKAHLGPVDLTSSVRESDGRAIVPRSAVMGSLANSFVEFLPVVLALALLILFSFLLGRSLISLAGLRHSEASVATMLGLSLLVAMIGSLNYLVSGRTAVLSVIVFSVGAITVAASRKGLRNFAVPRRYEGPLLPVLVGFLLYVVPTMMTRSLNVGFLQTDIYDYFHLQEVFWRESIPSAGTDWGWGLRTLDSTTRSGIENVFHLSSWEAATVVRLAFAMFAVVAIHSAATCLGASRRSASILASLTVALVPLHGLWLEGYLTRELFAHQVLMSIGVGVTILHRQDEDGTRQRKRLFLLGVLMVPALSIVPPYLVLVPALLLTLMIRRPQGAPPRTNWPPIRSFLLGLVPLSMINLWWMLGSDVSNRYAQAVEGIGKNIVVPFHSTARFPASLMGITSFHLNESSLFGRSLEGWVPGVLVDFHRRIDQIAGNWSVVLLLLLAVIVAVALSPRASGPAAGFLIGYVLISTVCTVLLLSVWKSQSFFLLMWFWTLAPGILVSAFLLIVRPGQRLQIGRLCILVTFLLLNVVASVFASTRWLNGPYGETSYRTHFDLAADVLFLEELEDSITTDFQVIMRDSELTGSDDDRVLFNFVDLVLTRDGRDCVNCVYDPRNGSVASLVAAEPTEQIVLIIGGRGCPEDYQMTNQSRSLLVCEGT